MTNTQDLFALASAADPNVCGCAVVAAGRPEWFTVARADGLVVRLDTATGAAPLQAAIDAVLGADLSAAAVSARVKARLRPVSDGAFQSTDALAVIERAIALVVIDEINLIRARLRAQDAAIAAATTLADLKTRWAALAAVPDRTAAQARQAVLDKIDGGGAD